MDWLCRLGDQNQRVRMHSARAKSAFGVGTYPSKPGLVLMLRKRLVA